MSDRRERIAQNLAQVREQIAAAEKAHGRKPDSVRLVAVVKYAAAEDAQTVAEAGCLDLGESRPQQLWEKAQQVAAPGVRWHMIGHLQRNKVRRTLPAAWLIHSVDSERLLVAVNEAAAALPAPARVLLEVNISGDDAKHGFDPDEIAPLLPRIATLANVCVAGLMGMASREGGRDIARQDFGRLRELRDRLRSDCPTEVSLDELSMGMSGDFTEAIAEGATMVRVGSALFAGLDS